MRSRPVSAPPRRWRGLVLLVIPAAVSLVATVALGLLAATSTRSLSDNVRLTQDLVDGNVRTLSQVQRELLRLENELSAPVLNLAQIDLHRAFAAQRVNEAALDYQGRTLGNVDLIARTQEFAQAWQNDLGPRVKQVVEDPTSVDKAARAKIVEDLGALELKYNGLVSDAENLRKVQASAANSSTATLVADTGWLIAGLVLTLLSFVTLVAGTVRMLLTARRVQLDAASRLKAAQALLQRHSIAVKTTDNLVIITDAQGRVEWVNEAFTRRTGWSLEEVLGARPGQLLQGPGTDPETVQFMRRHLRDKEPFTCEVLNYSRYGEEYWVSLEVHPIREDTDPVGSSRDGGGPVTGFVAVQADITKRRLAEEALVRAKESAEETALAKARFLASMSHEIRTPLNAVLGLTELLLDTELGDDQREYVATAHQSGRHLLALVGDILDFSALDTDQVEIETVPTNLPALLDDVRSMLQPAADRAGLVLTSHLAPDVPPDVLTDPVRLRQVLINLVGNGVKFTEEGQVHVEVSFDPDETDPSRGTLELAVRDTGIGIPPDRRDRIFEPFLQGDASTTRTHGGTGLGLAICTRIAQWLGGELNLESVEGEGSVFTLRMPVRAAAPAPANAVEPCLERSVERGPLRVLVAEDDAVNRMVAVHMLRRLGIECDIAHDGREAVEATAATAYDVVFMDVHMPVMDGVAATRAIRDRGGLQPRIIALTANALDGDRERMVGAGMDDYLSKPYRIDDLETALAAVPLPG